MKCNGIWCLLFVLEIKKNGKSTNEIKSNQEWNKFDNETSEANAKIFNYTSPDEFYWIAIHKYTKS